MENPLHLLNQNTFVRLFAAFLCFLLLTSEKTTAEDQQDSDVVINSLSIYPEKPLENDSIYLIVNATLTSTGCGIDEYDVNVINSEIQVTASFWQGEALAICTFADTLFIGTFDNGNYLLTFNYVDSLYFKIPFTGDEVCKANFTVLHADCDPTANADCTTGRVHFLDTSEGDVASWHWSFGDGHYSDGQHPQHTYESNGEYQVCLEIQTEDGCESKTCKTIRVNNAGNSCSMRGTVYDYTGLDGCGFIIELDNGMKLEPVKFLDEIELRDSMRVKLAFVPVNVASICMVGQPAIITCIKEINAAPCHANFTFVLDSTINDTDQVNYYHFYNKSRGEDLQYLWDFGDGHTSTAMNPGHSYEDSGVYTVCLKIYNEMGCEDITCKRLWVGINNQEVCKANFTHQYIPCEQLPVDFCPGYFVQFTDRSRGNALLYHWNFGDGNISHEQNPTHFYERPGIYPVTLKIESATDYKYCADKIVKLIKVGVPDSTCKAFFTFDSIAPYQFEFKFHSTNAAIDAAEVSWDFGDGATGHGMVVEHIFEANGVYEVCVTATTSDGCTDTYCEKIVVRNPWNNECQATFDYEILPCECANCACLHFTSNVTDDVVDWFWDFGDGNYSREPDPYHTYFNPQDRLYTVCLTIKTASGCKSTYCRKISVWGGGYQVPWQPVIAGEENHIIVVPENIQAPDLQYGDYLGLFFEDNNGKEICGGMMEWKDETSTLTAWGNTVEIWMSMMKNGFDPGETFKYKIWKHGTNRIIDIADASYETDELITDSSAYRDDGISKIKALTACDKQNIKLHKGWNLISLHVEPANKKMKHIFGNNQNIIVKDAAGNVEYFPHAGIYDGEWNILEGYKIKVWKNTWLRVCGSSIDPKTNIPLHGDSYPDFLPYYFPFEYPVEHAFREITDDIRYVQSLEYLDGSGTVMALNYIPAYGINQIGNMKPGLAYKLSLVNAWRSFTYPGPFTEDVIGYLPDRDSLKRNTPTNQMKAAFENSEKNRVLVIPEEILALETGDEINVYTSDDFYAGSWLYKGEGNTAVTLWDNPEMPGYMKFEIRVVDSNQNEVDRYLVDIEQDVKVDGDILELKKATMTSTGYPDVQEINVYPNPATNQLRFTLPVRNSAKVYVQVISLDGRTVIEQQLDGEGQEHEIQVDELKGGIYVLQVQTHENTYRTKFVAKD